MKKVNKSITPNLLDQHLITNPLDNWEQFRDNNQNAYTEVKTTLTSDQCGLCCYCEIDICNCNGMGLEDFRVEHFIPKSPHTPPPNHSLNWSNMLGCCAGGNQKDVYDSKRFTAPDFSCDVPKGNQNLSGIILDPLNDIPASHNLFKYTMLGSQIGEMKVDNTNCPNHLQTKAANSITYLNLNSERLTSQRAAVIEHLQEKIEAELASNTDIETAMLGLASFYLTKDSKNTWPAFFSCIRDFFGTYAEKHLASVGYDG